MNQLVLSKGRDPYSAWTPMQENRAAWVAGMFRSMGRRIHLRGLHYFIVSQPRHLRQWPDDTEYENTRSESEQWEAYAEYREAI